MTGIGWAGAVFSSVQDVWGVLGPHTVRMNDTGLVGDSGENGSGGVWRNEEINLVDPGDSLILAAVERIENSYPGIEQCFDFVHKLRFAGHTVKDDTKVWKILV